MGAAIFVWILLPETHGKKLSEIEDYFHHNFLAIGAEAKAKKRRARRRAQQNMQHAANVKSQNSKVTTPLVPQPVNDKT